MSGFSAQRPNFSLDVPQYALSQEGSGNQVNGRVSQNSSLKGEYAADGSWYSAQPMLLQPTTPQHGPLLHQVSGFPIGMAPASSVEPQYAFQHPSSAVTVPSVFHDPRSRTFDVAVTQQRSNTGYIAVQPQAMSMSAPVMGMGDWISQSVVPMTILDPVPDTTRMLKKPRQQFSACTACRTRRVKCDLKDIRLEWEKVHNGGNLEMMQTLDIAESEQLDSSTLDGKKKKVKATLTEKPNLAAISKKEDVPCTNCYNRETTCIDEFAHRKRNKGKRPIQESVTRKRSHDIFEEDSHKSQSMHSVDPGSPQRGNALLNPQILGLQETRRSTTLRPDLPRLWSGTSEPADVYSPHEFTYDLGHSTPAGAALERPEALVVLTTPQDGKPMAESSLERSVSSQQNLLALDPQQSSSNISPAATDYDSRDSMLPSDYRHIYSNPASVAPSTPRSISSKGISKGTKQNNRNTLGDFRIPDLKPSFFESDFYRRFHIQRPLIDAIDFANRYKSAYLRSALDIGHVEGILYHVLYAWASSYGIDESGQPFLQSQEWYRPEGAVYLDRQQQSSIRESARQRQLEQTNRAVRQILNEIDQAGILRSITWDGVRCLLLILPLTEYISSATERLAMYECALGQVFSLCSASALGYDGLPVIPSPEQEVIRRKLYWYAFVHEGITTGLKGGRMVLDEDDLSSLDDVLPQTARLALTSSRTYQSVAKFASAPIRLAMACRLIHKALTGAKARRSERVDRRLLNDAWEALEESWIEFEGIKAFSPDPLTRQDDVVRFADGWRIFAFHAHNVIRESLEHRAHVLTRDRESAQLTDLGIAENQPHSRDQYILEIQQLRTIARAKCDHMLQEIVGIIKQHVNTNFFEWDASLVRDGTYYAAMLLAETNGTDSDISCCLEALSEMRWAFARTQERSNELYQAWSSRQTTSQSFSTQGQTSAGNIAQAARSGQPMNLFNNRPLSIYSLEPGLSSIASINNAESDLLASTLDEEQQSMPPQTDGGHNLHTQHQQQQYQPAQYLAPANPNSTSSSQVISWAVDGTRAVHQYPDANVYAQPLVTQRPEQTEKLTGWTNQHAQYSTNQIVTGAVYPLPPPY